MTFDFLAIKLDPDQKIYAWRNGHIVVPIANVVPLGEWNQIRISFGYDFQPGNSPGRGIVRILGGIGTSTESLAAIPFTTFPQTPSTSDKIRIGGPDSFLGEIAKLDIYNPGALSRCKKIFFLLVLTIILKASWSPTTCDIDLGFGNPPVCLWETCQTGEYYFKSTCQSALLYFLRSITY